MKRIESACLEQTIHFILKEDMDPAEASELAQREAQDYKEALTRKQIPHKIEEEHTLPDGSVMLKIKKQYNSYPCGNYLQ